MLYPMSNGNLMRGTRGLSQTTSIIIAAVIVVLFSGVIMWMLRAALGLLWIVLQIAVLVVAILVVAHFIRKMSKKV